MQRVICLTAACPVTHSIASHEVTLTFSTSQCTGEIQSHMRPCNDTHPISRPRSLTLHAPNAGLCIACVSLALALADIAVWRRGFHDTSPTRYRSAFFTQR